MERPQILGTEDIPRLAGILDRCRECRGHLVQVGEEVACTSCGVVARRERLPTDGAAAGVRGKPSRKLGSFLGNKSDEDSPADFNGVSTVGYVKRIADHIGDDQAAWNCSAMIGRVAEKLSLPGFVKENATVLSERILADCRKDGGSSPRRKISVPTISAYSLLAACRAAGIDHVGSKAVLKAYVDMGHRVRRSGLLRLGTDSRVTLRPANSEALVATVVAGLESSKAVGGRLLKHGVEPREYFARLAELSRALTKELRAMKEGNSPRTVAAGAVYLASRRIGPRIVTQKEAGNTLGVAEYTIREYCGWALQEFGQAGLNPLNGGRP
jgi:transcription initiation factor TFIIIB Brf1 subunit/transcription initiation factor TFIIB